MGSDDRAERAFFRTQWTWKPDGLHARGCLPTTVIATTARYHRDGARVAEEWTGPEPHAAEEQLVALWDTLAPFLAQRVAALRLPDAHLYLRLKQPWKSPAAPGDAALPAVPVNYDPARDEIVLPGVFPETLRRWLANQADPRLAVVTGKCVAYRGLHLCYLLHMNPVCPADRQVYGKRVVLRFLRSASQPREQAHLTAAIEAVRHDVRARLVHD